MAFFDFELRNRSVRTTEDALSRLDPAGHCESGHKNVGTKLAVEVHQVVGDQ